MDGADNVEPGQFSLRDGDQAHAVEGAGVQFVAPRSHHVELSLRMRVAVEAHPLTVQQLEHLRRRKESLLDEHLPQQRQLEATRPPFLLGHRILDLHGRDVAGLHSAVPEA